MAFCYSPLPRPMARRGLRIRIGFCLNSIKAVYKSRFYGITHLAVGESAAYTTDSADIT